MDIKAKIEEIINKIKGDKDLGEKFQKDPSGAVKEVAGVDIPEDTLKEIVEGVKGKIKLDNIGDAIGGLFGKKD